MQFRVPDMTCGGCARAITRAVQALDPQAVVDADPAAKTVAVQTRADETAVRAAIVEAGYTPQPVG